MKSETGFTSLRASGGQTRASVLHGCCPQAHLRMTRAPTAASMKARSSRPRLLMVGTLFTSVLFATFDSLSAGVAVALLAMRPTELILAVTVIVTLAPEARLGMVHGKAEQPPPVTFVMVMFVGVSVT